MEKEFYEPLQTIEFEGFVTDKMLSPEEAQACTQWHPMPEGTRWGRTWEYAWMRGRMVMPEAAAGQRIVMDLNQGGEATLFVNGEAFGTRRAEWVYTPHHLISDQLLTLSAVPGESYDLLLESYAGMTLPPNGAAGSCVVGPLRQDTEDGMTPPEGTIRQTVGHSTFGIWHEKAYALWLDVTCLMSVLSAIDPQSLRAAEIEEALERFTMTVDFEKPRSERERDYDRARELLKPVMQAHNGSTMPRFTAVGNAHLDLSWLWSYRETQRKVARTFAAQVRLMDLYPEYRFIQSQPESYRICKELYPRLYERVKEKIRAGQWIADGAMWVEPDTNMSGGEALIRQLVYGKRFYREEFGVECRLLWLPDTFGYSAVLPQLLRGCGVTAMTTQKIFWNYNGGERFPYHYFTWQGMDGSEVTAFLHMDYTSTVDPATIIGRWRDRVQKRGLSRFLLPYGYGDGGGGPTRDDLELLRRQRDLEGVPRVEQASPQQFFDEYAAEGGPKEQYTGELYFACHRGTYTSQAAVKRNNRRSENALREAELWNAVSGRDYPAEQLEKCWRDVLLNQFHDILPGSSIGRVYEEAAVRHQRVLKETEEMTLSALGGRLEGQTGVSCFNSLSFSRHEVIETPNGFAVADVPSMGATSVISTVMPEHPVTCETQEDGSVVMGNGLVTARINSLGEIVSLQDKNGHERIRGTANVLKMYQDTPRSFEAWDIDSMTENMPIPLEQQGTLTVEQQSPFRATLRVERRIGTSLWTQRIRLDCDRTRLDFITHVDWQEQHCLLKAHFATGVHAEEGINEIQFGFIRRPTHRSRQGDKDRFEVCNHRFTALCDEGRGAAVLNDCKYGVSMQGDEIALSLLRGPRHPDPKADIGAHDFTYAYDFWDGAFLDSPVVQEGLCLNNPLRVLPGQTETFSVLETDRPNIIVDTVKKAMDGEDLILRLYECKHAATEAKLQLHVPARKVFACDMEENILQELPLEKGTVPLSFRGFEIKTLRVQA